MQLIRARWVWPGDSPVVGDGAVAIEDRAIAAVGAWSELHRQFPQVRVSDLGNSLILPGLVNAHTHLELSFLKGQVPYLGDFVDWARRVVRQRASFQRDYDNVLQEACQESLAAGVTTVGDISYENRAWAVLREQPIRKTCYAEVFGITSNIQPAKEYLTQCLEQAQTDPMLQQGISTHAPYSVGKPLYEYAAGLAKEHDLPLTTHLAETLAEAEFTQSGTGLWQEYLQERGLWDGSFTASGRTPVDYFLGMNLSDQSVLLAHVNYLSNAELDALAKSPHSVVYCPRAHRFFGHPPHRFREMLAAGINVCLGTDSLASNESLSILDEMRFIYKEYPDLRPETILQMGTANGATALGWGATIGRLQVGSEADLTAIPLPGETDKPLKLLLLSEQWPSQTMVAGRWVFGQRNESIL